MNDDLLSYYQSELAFIRRAGAEFARANPERAGQLGISESAIKDPFVERLVEAFSLLTARTRKRIEDDFPELAGSILDTLYPHYLAPMPSMAVIQMGLGPAQAQAVKGHAVPVHSPVETEQVVGEMLRYRTARDLTLWPLEVTGVSMAAPPWSQQPDGTPVKAALKITLKTLSDSVRFGDMALESLPFFLSGESDLQGALYELMLRRTAGVVLTNTGSTPTPTDAAVQANEGLKFRPVGFEADEAVLPEDPRTHRAHRMLSEYFAFPDAFYFVELTGIQPTIKAGLGSSVDLWLLLNEPDDALDTRLNPDAFRLGCVPIVNLFERRADPIEANHTQTDYHLVPDVRRPRAIEIFSVDAVELTGYGGRHKTVYPFYSVDHHLAEAQKNQTEEHEPGYFIASRRAASVASGGPDDDRGTEIDLSIVDLDFSPAEPIDWTIQATVTCCNRDLPSQLPFGGGRPQIRLVEGGAIRTIQCLTRPTPTLRGHAAKHSRWQLISHLALNHLSFTNNEHGADALKEQLMLYNIDQRPALQQQIDGVLSIDAERDTARIAPGETGLCAGMHTTLTLDDARFPDRGMFLFASVIDRFLALSTTINSFSRLTVRTPGRDEEYFTWAPRAGDTPLL